MNYFAAFAGTTLLAGVMVLLMTASPAVALFGKYAIYASLLALATLAAAYVLRQGFAAHVLRNEDFHWY